MFIPAPGVIRHSLGPVHNLRWISLPLEGVRVDEVVIFGSGKDTDLTIRLTDGRAIELSINDVRLVLHDGAIVESTRWDDVSRTVRLSGPDLSIRRAAVAWPGPDEDCITGLMEDVRTAFQPDRQPGHVNYVVSVELELERRK